jgi:hypothetical protein
MASLAAVPVIRNISDTASFAITVKPYLEQLPDLASQVVAVLRTKSSTELVSLYTATNPILSATAFSLIVGAIAFVSAEVNRNYSQIDRLWSILPVVYIGHYNLWARQAGISSTRLDLLLLCASIWGSRLTFNFWRKGGYKIGEEDYRWPVIKKKIGPVAMFLLNLTFISFIQSVSIIFGSLEERGPDKCSCLDSSVRREQPGIHSPERVPSPSRSDSPGLHLCRLDTCPGFH